MVRKDEKYYRTLTDEYKDLIICPKMNKEDFREFLIRQYRLVPASAEQIGLCDVYDDFFGWVTENRLKPFCELTGTGYNPEGLKYELFESDIPVAELTGQEHIWFSSIPQVLCTQIMICSV